MTNSKTEKKIKIIFMGTPDFAVPALTALHNNKYDVILVVTQPDRPKGRGRKPVSSPVKEAAAQLGYDVIQPVSIKTDEFANNVIKLKPDMFVVSAFGHILPKSILELPKIGALNIHASLLPKYRGAAPIQWAIINGEKETGVTIMLMDEGLDTGDILFTSKIQIFPDDTSATLHNRLADLGADLLIKTLKAIEADNINPIPQDHTIATYAPMLKKKDGHINWEMAAEKLEAFIRGMTPWPGAFAFCDNTRLKIFSSKPIMIPVDKTPGTVLKGFPDELRIATGKGALSILEIQGQSGKRLLIKDFLRGFKMPVGTVLN
ncbi:MAG: methionyl-tRNA formyltransferase [Desulfobacterales bacterium]|nr:methionyl-tRNA formyltransferase [Desulfobacterales bacterium]